MNSVHSFSCGRRSESRTDIQRRIQHDVERQLVTARALTHRFRIDGTVVVACGVPHRSLRVVHRTCGLTDEGDRHVVGHHVGLLAGPLHLLQPEDALEVEHVGIGALDSRGLVVAVHVEEQAVFGGRFREAVGEIGDLLVVAVEEIDLEALDAHLRVVFADAFEVAFRGIETGPEDDAHAAFLAVGDQFGQVDRGNDLEKVGLFVHGPAFVEDDVFDAVVGGESM